MERNVAGFYKRISRRTVLSVAATSAVAMPALANECLIGPPAHVKGPLVWMNMDQVELDAAYDQSFYAPLAAAIGKRRVANSEAARARLGQPARMAYGPSEAEKLDIYRAKQPKAPIFLFIHGGAWLGGEAKNYGDSAELFVNAGAIYVPIDFTGVKAAKGDIRVMADQVRNAIAWTYKNAASFGGDPDRLYIGGHSSGGHLCGVALTTDWQKDFGLPPNAIKGGLCMSGMYDMKPVRLSQRSSYVAFTDEIEAQMSSLRHIDKLVAPVIATYGTEETPEFQRQNRDFVTAVKAAGKPIRLVEAIGYNHFEMGESLGDPYGPNGRAALALMGLGAA